MLRSTLRSSCRYSGSSLALGSSRSLTTASLAKQLIPQATVTRRPGSLTAHRRCLNLAPRNNSTDASSKGVDPSDSFLQGNTANYIDEMYLSWKRDPSSVHISWQVYFRNMEGDGPPSQAFQAPPTLVPTPTGGVPSLVPGAHLGGNTDVTKHLKVQLLVRAYQVRGHHKANIDPLGIRSGVDLNGTSKPRELDLDHYQFTEKDLDDEYTLGPGILPRFAVDGKEKMTLREIISACEKTYCGSYGIEYVHIADRDQCDWIRERVEIPTPWEYDNHEKRRILDRLIWSSSFESFLSNKYPNDKRFGLEGCEALVPGMKALIDRSVDRGVKDIIIGMPHRGRLNVLSNVVRKPNESIFSEFGGTAEPSDEGSGDVKYHLGMNFERPTPSGKRVQLSLVANPSHLEAEDPVVLGKTRALQHFNNDEKSHNSAMGVLVHGDAAFAAQGIVYETMGFHALPAYSTGGTIHLIVNNQIGFTTDPRFARSTPYCSDIAKSIDAPIFHVNADDVEAVNFVCELASDWRAQFKRDVVIDLVCYRKYGHNETDQPSFTQPLMYRKIAEKQHALDRYIARLLEEGTFTENDIQEHKNWVWSMLEDSFAKSREYQPTAREWLTSAWNGSFANKISKSDEQVLSRIIGFKTPKELSIEVLPHLPTAVEEGQLKRIGDVIGSVPEGFSVHRNLSRILSNRKKVVHEGTGIDWSTAEALAFGSLLMEGQHVRVSGQDVERGTFSQRHAVLHDQEDENTYTPLQHLGDTQANFVISNSSLSEFGVLGFEYGYSLSSPDALVIWEAQFGDFANNAQCIIDQFIASGESKWFQRTGIVMSLPHGYDGQGPEHSSGRMERYLQLCNEDPREFPCPAKLDRQHQDCNMQVAYMTSPSNLFHVLRRQMKRQFRKPLIIFFSKSLLRHPSARSELSEFTGDSHFRWLIPETAHGKGIKDPVECKRLLFCSGQVYAALVKQRVANGVDDVAIARIEQLHPFPWAQIRDELEKYPNLEEIIWTQEEPLNAGAWTFVQPRLETILRQTENHSAKHVKYAGRAPSASVATGMKSTHLKEEQALVNDALGISPH